MSHPIRSDFLRLLAEWTTLTPKRALELLPGTSRVGLSQINYHVGVLEKSKLVEPLGEPGRYGGLSYRATDTGREVMVLIGAVPGGRRSH